MNKTPTKLVMGATTIDMQPLDGARAVVTVGAVNGSGEERSCVIWGATIHELLALRALIDRTVKATKGTLE